MHIKSRAVHFEVVGGGCRAATTPPAFSGRNPIAGRIIPPLNAARRVSPPTTSGCIKSRGTVPQRTFTPSPVRGATQGTRLIPLAKFEYHGSEPAWANPCPSHRRQQSATAWPAPGSRVGAGQGGRPGSRPAIQHRPFGNARLPANPALLPSICSMRRSRSHRREEADNHDSPTLSASLPWRLRGEIRPTI
jgi:hypothetical protein